MNTDRPPSADPVDFARALADRTRQALMRLCCCEWRSVGELAEALRVSQPTVSHHLAVLREAHLVRARPEGRQTFYTLNQDQVAVCCGALMLRYAPDVALTTAPSEES
ncbi:MAG TPA: metalloregulator ArsR/SmtB family transcription factor [Anaerolineales bacterium]|nr:metalloregulator ArsR/SmtB family transcription factor [Anaerolineales bacterium]